MATLIKQTGGSNAAEYTGPVSVTPDTTTQTLNTSGYLLTQNITVDPIPSNYGLITWNGSYLLIS